MIHFATLHLLPGYLKTALMIAPPSVQNGGRRRNRTCGGSARFQLAGVSAVHSAHYERIYPFSHGALSHRLRGRLEGRKQLSSGGRGRSYTGLWQLWQSAARAGAARIEAREARDRYLSLGLRLSRGGAAHSPRAARGSVLLRSRSAGVWSASRDASALPELHGGRHGGVGGAASYARGLSRCAVMRRRTERRKSLLYGQERSWWGAADALDGPGASIKLV